MTKYIIFKLLATAPIAFVITEPQETIIWGIVYIVAIDTVLGIWVAIKYRVFHSSNLKRLISKAALYGFAMLNVWILASVDSTFCIVYKYMGIFIIVTEIISNFEKLALLGFHTPTKLISLLNKKFNGILEEPKKAEAIVDERNKCC